MASPPAEGAGDGCVGAGRGRGPAGDIPDHRAAAREAGQQYPVAVDAVSGGVVQNIGDEDYYTAAYRSGAFLYKGDERRGTVTLTGRF